MTSPESRRDRAQPIHLELRRNDAGTLLGAIAWVMGALQIMKDRGHAESDEEFHDLHDAITPILERLVTQITAAREVSVTQPQFEVALDAAYTEVREAFEAWIQLTAMDTLSVAVAQRLGPDGMPEEPETPPEG
jgi:hypothetical protein